MSVEKLLQRWGREFPRWINLKRLAKDLEIVTDHHFPWFAEIEDAHDLGDEVAIQTAAYGVWIAPYGMEVEVGWKP